MLCLGKDAKTPQLFIQILHKVGDPGADGAEIVIIQLLTLGRLCAKEGTAGQPQVFTLGVNTLGNQEILLLRADADLDTLGLIIAKQTQNTQSFPGNFIQGAQQGRFLVQGFSGVGEEAGGYVQTAVFYKSKCGRIPGGVATCFEGGAQTTGGKTGSVRLTTNQWV